MDTAKRCREQSDECLRLMNLAQSETEARLLRDLAHSWVRIANQTERYAKFIAVQSAGYARSPDRVERAAGPRLTAVALDLKPATSAIEALRDSRRELGGTAITFHLDRPCFGLGAVGLTYRNSIR